jgi:hypothetical protein
MIRRVAPLVATAIWLTRGGIGKQRKTKLLFWLFMVVFGYFSAKYLI